MHKLKTPNKKAATGLGASGAATTHETRTLKCKLTPGGLSRFGSSGPSRSRDETLGQYLVNDVRPPHHLPGLPAAVLGELLGGPPDSLRHLKWFRLPHGCPFSVPGIAQEPR